MLQDIGIQLTEEQEIPLPELMALYQDAGWTAYTKSPERLYEAVRASLLVISARKKGELVGLIRAVGDGQTILYIQDILVKKKFKRKKIGTGLLHTLLERFPDVRQKVLITDDTPETRSFYEANGFKSNEKYKLVAFMKMDSQ